MTTHKTMIRIARTTTHRLIKMLSQTRIAITGLPIELAEMMAIVMMMSMTALAMTFLSE